MLYATIYDPPFRASVLKGHMFPEEDMRAGLTPEALSKLAALKALRRVKDLTLFNDDLSVSVKLDTVADVDKAPEGFRTHIVGMTPTRGFENVMSWVMNYLPSSKESLWRFLINRELGNKTHLFLRIFGNVNGVRYEKVNNHGVYVGKANENEPTHEEVRDALRNEVLTHDTESAFISFGSQVAQSSDKFLRTVRAAGVRYYPPIQRSEHVHDMEYIRKIGNFLVTDCGIVMNKDEFAGPGIYVQLHEIFK